MSVRYPPESEYAKEVVKWEAQYTDCGPGKRPYVKRDFPMTLHKAGRRDAVTPDILEILQVGDEAAMTRARAQGFYPTPLEALDAFEALDLEIAKLAAERHAIERRMSAQAQAEAAKADEADGSHVPSVPETPVSPRAARR